MSRRRAAGEKYLADLLPTDLVGQSAVTIGDDGPELEEHVDLEKMEFYLYLEAKRDPGSVAYVRRYLAHCREDPEAKVRYVNSGVLLCVFPNDIVGIWAC